MAKVKMTTRNGDRVTVHTRDPEEIAKLENAPFDDSSNIAVTRVTETGK
jgi:hypothetical protein